MYNKGDDCGKLNISQNSIRLLTGRLIVLLYSLQKKIVIRNQTVSYGRNAKITDDKMQEECYTEKDPSSDSDN